jgi:integrase/recombinase XerD
MDRTKAADACMVNDVTTTSLSPILHTSPALPAVFQSSSDSGRRFLEFFTVNIRNPNTRKAYFHAVAGFAAWCEERGLYDVKAIAPVHVAAYSEQLIKTHSKPTAKQHLAAVRMLFDWLVTGEVIAVNPAHAVRGPKHSVKKGKTSVLVIFGRPKCRFRWTDGPFEGFGNDS